MATAVGLPSELRAFLTLPGPQSLVIRGAAGTGKSTLALTMLEAFAGTKLLVSGRVSRGELSREFPWATSDGIRIVDTVSPNGTGEPSRARNARRVAVGSPLAGRLPSGSDRAVASIPRRFDTAWDRAEVAQEEDGAPAWVPASLRLAWPEVEPGQPSIIAIDPWEAFLDEHLSADSVGDGPFVDRAELERRLLRQVARGTSHLVLILERDGSSPLDYLVNGIVDLRRGTFEHQPDRWASLPKLRGIRIEVESYPFSLDRSRFQCVPPEGSNMRVVRAVSEPEPAGVRGMLWPGSTDFANAFGRLPHRAMTLIDTDPGVSEASVQSIVFPVVLSVLKSGGRVFLLPPPGSRIAERWQQFEADLPPGVFPRQVRILHPGLTLPPDHPLASSVVPLPPEVASFGITPRTRRGWEFITRSAKPGAANLVFVAAEGLRSLARITGGEYTAENLPTIAQAYLSGEAPVHQILLARTGGPLSEATVLRSALHLRMLNRNGRTFLYGVNPVTPAYVLSPRDDERPYDLVRVV